MTFENVFPDFDNGHEFRAIGILLGDGFADSSYRNDACPSYFGATDESHEFGVSVFVEYRNPDMRESGDGATRFHVVAQYGGATVLDKSFSDMAQCAVFARIILAALRATDCDDLDSACELIQDAARQNDGGIAGQYFDGNTAWNDPGEAWRGFGTFQRLRYAVAYGQAEFAHAIENTGAQNA
jgi:hypothetical protein